jgi:hypothetical protein
MNRNRHDVIFGAICTVFMCMAAVPALAQHEYEPLFDKFNFRLEGSFVDLTTEIRLDSEELGKGTTLNFEDDLDLDPSKIIPSLSFEWQIARKHKLGFRWQDISRDSSSQALTEIDWGGEVIPIEADISLGFDITQYFVDYAYYPWVKERWAAGFGLGIRFMTLQVTLAWREENVDEEGSSDVKGTGPLPYLYFEYRRLLSDNWRFVAGLGWLKVSIDDIDGSQYIGRLSIEYLMGKRWGIGAVVNLAQIDVDWNAISTEEADILNAAIAMDVNDISIFARVRF